MRLAPTAAVRLAVALAGWSWLVAAAVSGQRYPALSRSWAFPAIAGFAAVAVVALLMAAAARRLGERDPLGAAERSVSPLWLSWPVLGLLLASDQANHYFVHWPRLRVAAVSAVTGLMVVASEVALLRAAERGRGLLSRTVRRCGVPGLVFASAFAVYVASAGGHLYTPDEWTLYAVSAGLVNHGVPAAYAGEPYPLHHMLKVNAAPGRPTGQIGEREAGTYVYTKFGIVPSLLAAPVYAVARVTGPGPELPAQVFPYENRALPLVPLLVNPIITAAIAALLYQVARDLGYGSRPALAAAGAFALGSMAWPYSKTLMNMTLAGGLLLAALWCMQRASIGRYNVRWLLGSGVAAGLSAATRYETVLFALPILAFGLHGRQRHQVLRAGALVAAAMAITAVPLIFGLNLLRTGSAVETGYGGEGTLSSLAEKPWYGLFGILLSPGCGLVPHTPLIALGIIAIIWFWEDSPFPALVVGAVSLLAVAYYGSLNTWCGYAAWGPRYLLTVAPLMALPLAALWKRLGDRGAPNPFAWLLLGGLAAWSMGTNLLAVLIDFNRGWQDHWANERTYTTVTWLPYFSGITTHWRLLRQWLLDGVGGLDLYLLYAHPVVGPALLVTLALVAVAAAVAAWEGTPHPPALSPTRPRAPHGGGGTADDCATAGRAA
ncbi:MAG: glycosyltransferase family 39 protein [Chloroflexi bacterium]|nr:glycosyltransferase family 39 protein [Chloroflexota bacterium]